MQELNTNTENIIETLKEIASTPEIKKYCYSTGFHLFEYAIGFEENDKFTGVVIYNQKVFYLERGTIIELDVNINNLMNNYSKELKTVIKEFKRNLIDDGSVYNPEKMNNCDIYRICVNGNQIFFSEKNYKSEFKTPFKDLISNYYLTDEKIKLLISPDAQLSVAFVKLDRMRILSENNPEIVVLFDDLISNYGLMRKPKRKTKSN